MLSKVPIVDVVFIRFVLSKVPIVAVDTFTFVSEAVPKEAFVRIELVIVALVPSKLVLTILPIVALVDVAFVTEIDAADKDPEILAVPPTFKLPLIPAPPATVIAPFEAFVLAAVFDTFKIPCDKRPP